MVISGSDVRRRHHALSYRNTCGRLRGRHCAGCAVHHVVGGFSRVLSGRSLESLVRGAGPREVTVTANGLLSGKVAVVTGAHRGIGNVIAIAFIEAGPQ